MTTPTTKTINELVLPELEKATKLEDLPIEVVAGLLIGLLTGRPEVNTVDIEKTSRITSLTFDISEGSKARAIGKRGHTLKAIRSVCKSIERSRMRDVIIDLPGYEVD